MTNHEPDIRIPPKFWQSLSALEFRGIVRRSGLDSDQCARLWKMMDYQGSPPIKLDVFIKQDDFLKVFPKQAARSGLFRS
jgi:hypothetical protein